MATDSPREALSWSIVACGGVCGGAAPLVVIDVLKLLSLSFSLSFASLSFRYHFQMARSVVGGARTKDDDDCSARGCGDFFMLPVNWWKHVRAPGRIIIPTLFLYGGCSFFGS